MAALPELTAAFLMPEHRTRCQKLRDALTLGMIRNGDKVVSSDWDCDVLCIWGMHPRWRDIYRRRLDAGKAVVVFDLPYWRRDRGNVPQAGSAVKVSVGYWHPMDYCRRALEKPVDRSRFAALNVPIRPYRRRGDHILLAGLGPKSCDLYGIANQAWERETIARLRQHSDRPIVYRPKPSWSKRAPPIPGTTFSPAEQAFADVLRGAWAVVTHHSNASLEAVVNGIPAFATDGVGSLLSLADLSRIEDPWHAEPRANLCAAVAHCQWTFEEVRRGRCWHHLKETRQIP